MRRSGKLGARYSVVIGGNEVETGRANFNRMADGEQVEAGLVAGEIFLIVCKLENN